jgi:hypothetical protein
MGLAHWRTYKKFLQVKLSSIKSESCNHILETVLGYKFELSPGQVAQWLRFCATNRKVAGSIPDGVTEFFRRHNPSDRTMAWGRLSL